VGNGVQRRNDGSLTVEAVSTEPVHGLAAAASRRRLGELNPVDVDLSWRSWH